MSLSLIVAVSENNVIGKDNQLPWHVSDDLKFFKKMTKGHAVIMGRKTYESIGRPLPMRTNIVVTRQDDFCAPGCLLSPNFRAAIALAKETDPDPFVIGGSSLYETALKDNLVDTIYFTRIKGDFEGDSYFPELDFKDWKVKVLEETDQAKFFKLTRPQSGE